MNSRTNYHWLGISRERKQYDHSRNGPIMAGTWCDLKRELNGIGQCLPLAGKGQSITMRELQQTRFITPRS